MKDLHFSTWIRETNSGAIWKELFNVADGVPVKYKKVLINRLLELATEAHHEWAQEQE